MGDIGPNPKPFIFEPIEAPAIPEPEPAPAPAPEPASPQREPVPA